MRRATVSDALPGACGTIKRTGRFGYSAVPAAKAVIGHRYTQINTAAAQDKDAARIALSVFRSVFICIYLWLQTRNDFYSSSTVLKSAGRTISSTSQSSE